MKEKVFRRNSDKCAIMTLFFGFIQKKCSFLRKKQQ